MKVKVLEIYKKFKVPPNLQEHLLRVTKVGLYISDKWVGKIDPNIIKIAGLLHDIGNIVKFDFKTHPEFLGEEQSRVSYWIAAKDEIVKKYGADDHMATEAMLKEIGIDKRIVHLVLSKSFANSIKTKDSNNWELKVMYYADLRVGPYGVIPLKQRLDEVLGRLDKYKDLKNLNELISACYDLEKQIQKKVTFNLRSLNDQVIKDDNQKLLDTEIPTH
jgi:hypothetical protein